MEAVVVIVGMGLFVGHGAWSGPAGRRTARRVAGGRSALRAVLDEGPADRRAPTARAGGGPPADLARLPRHLRIRVLVEVAPRLTGAQRRRLTALAAELGLLSLAEARCRSRLWWRRLRGARLFTLLGGGRGCVPALVADRRPEVRAQAARWVVEHYDDELVDRLLGMLHADDAATRFTVKDCLIRIGRPVVGRLASHLSLGAGPGLAPALEVAAALPDPSLLPAALALCEDHDPGIRARAAGVAGAVGGGAAVGALMKLMGDEAAQVRAAAARALGRAGHWPAAASLARLLADSSWDVRRQAAVALRTLGSPGQLFLRRALSAADPLAADAARHMLDLPDSALRAL